MLGVPWEGLESSNSLQLEGWDSLDETQKVQAKRFLLWIELAESIDKRFRELVGTHSLVQQVLADAESVWRRLSAPKFEMWNPLHLLDLRQYAPDGGGEASGTTGATGATGAPLTISASLVRFFDYAGISAGSRGVGRGDWRANRRARPCVHRSVVVGDVLRC